MAPDPEPLAPVPLAPEPLTLVDIQSDRLDERMDEMKAEGGLGDGVSAAARRCCATVQNGGRRFIVSRLPLLYRCLTSANY